MARKSLLYFLFSQNKKPLYVDDNGHVQEGNDNLQKPNGQPAHIEFAPDGWKDVLVKYARNIKWWGTFRDFTVPMKFVKDGATILKNVFWNYGIEAICYLGIAKLDRMTLPYSYEGWYNSELNFAKYKETLTGVQIEALEGGLIKYMKANESTTYSFPVDGDGKEVYVLMDGLDFNFNRTFGIPGDQPVRGNDDYYMGMTETSREGDAPDIFFQDIFFQSSIAPPNDNWFMKSDLNKVAGNVQFKGTLNIHYDKTCTPQIRIEVNNNETGLNAPGTPVTIFNTAGNAGEDKTQDFDVTINIPANHQAHVKLFGGAPSDSNVQYRVNGLEMSINYEYKFKPTYIKAFFPYHLLEIITLKLSSNQNSIVSQWLANKNDIVITSGDALRGIPGATMKTSLADYFKSFFARWGVGMGTTNGGKELLFEDLPYFFKSSIITDIGQVLNAEITTAEDLLFNTIKAGYDLQDYTDVNGRYEVNQGQQWTAPVSKVIKELDITSPYRADPFGIELLRINFDQKTTTDSSSDNNCFFLNIDPTLYHDNDLNIDYYKLNRPAYTAITGVPYPLSIFNVELSPKRGLLNLGAYLHSLLDLLDIQKLSFQSADKNADLSTTLAGVTITEKEDIQIGSLAKKLFKPYYITFTTQVPLNLLALIEANPYGKIQFTWNDQTWYGWLMDGGVKPATHDAQQWKLLAAPENDFKKFNKAI